MSKLTDKLSEAHARVANLEQSKQDIDLLGNDPDNTYAFNRTEGGIHRVWQGDDGKVYIDTSSDALSIHEITHVRQSLTNGGLSFYNDNLENIGSNMPNGENRFKTISAMEVEAYRMQYSYDLSFPGYTRNLQGINVHSVGNIGNGAIYKEIHAYSEFLKQRERLMK